MVSERYDAIIVGGGLFGCALARQLSRLAERVLVIEKEDDLVRRASYANQARIHQGYHYPRSLLTGWRSRVNFQRFVTDFPDCIYRRFDMYYAIAATSSNVGAAQFRSFCDRIQAPLRRAPDAVRKLFRGDLVEDVFAVEECAFDAERLRARLWSELRQAGVEVRLGSEVARVWGPAEPELRVLCRGGGADEILRARRVFNCTYSEVNRLLSASALPTIPLRYELAEIALVEVPDELRNLGITVMCGPFFSVMPFPPRGVHSLTHVRYTPHYTWSEPEQGPTRGSEPSTNFPAMVRDASRFLPLLADCRHVGSLWEVKALLPESDVDDSRPILVARDPGMPNLTSVVGAKIDNVYDVLERLADERMAS